MSSRVPSGVSRVTARVDPAGLDGARPHRVVVLLVRLELLPGVPAAVAHAHSGAGSRAGGGGVDLQVVPVVLVQPVAVIDDGDCSVAAPLQGFPGGHRGVGAVVPGVEFEGPVLDEFGVDAAVGALVDVLVEGPVHGRIDRRPGPGGVDADGPVLARLSIGAEGRRQWTAAQPTGIRQAPWCRPAWRDLVVLMAWKGRPFSIERFAGTARLTRRCAVLPTPDRLGLASLDM